MEADVAVAVADDNRLPVQIIAATAGQHAVCQQVVGDRELIWVPLIEGDGLFRVGDEVRVTMFVHLPASEGG